MSVVTRPTPEPVHTGTEADAPPAVDGTQVRQTAAPPRDSLGLRVAAFAALAAFGTSHWMGLVSDPGWADLPVGGRGRRRGVCPGPLA